MIRNIVSRHVNELNADGRNGGT